MTRPETPGKGGPPDSDASVRQRRLRPRLRRVDIAVAALVGLLGFAAVVQVRSTRGESVLAAARQEDLVQILDNLSNRSLRLRQEVATLTATRDRLTTGGQDAAAIAEARRRALVLGVLAGTVAARGPGILVTISDPRSKITGDVLLDALEEMRDAGAEAIQIEGPVSALPATATPTATPTAAPISTSAPAAGPAVRVVASTHFEDPAGGGGVQVDGTVLSPPYRFVVVGDPATLAAALAIPGGVIDNVAQRGGRADVERRATVVVGALRTLARPRYARSTGSPTG